MELLSDALRLCQDARCARVEAQVLHRMGEVCLLTGELARAIDSFEQARVITSDIGDLIGEAYALQGLGVGQVRQGEFDQARGALQRAVELAGRVGEHMAEATAVLGLGELALASGEPGQAVILERRAAAVFEEMKAPFYQARALTLLSDAYIALDDADAAQAASAQAAMLRTKLIGDEGTTS
jgi:tetratricopeptide (TPR) repeat protein